MHYEAEHFPGWWSAAVFDAATGLRVTHVRWLNDETHEYARYVGNTINLTIERAPKIVYLKDRNVFLVNMKEVEEGQGEHESATRRPHQPVPA